MENGPSNMGRREFLKKLGGALAGTAIASSALAAETNKVIPDTNETGNIIREKIINDLLTKKEVIPNQGKEFLEKVDYWYKRHIKGGDNYQSLKDGWTRLLDSSKKNQSDLEIVSDIFKREGVPNELIFLAMTESYWNKNALNHGSSAAGIWQFIPDTAKRFGIKNTKDIRETTEAACKYLKLLKNLAKKCGNEIGVSVNDSDAWLWAFLAYNRGEGYVLERPSGKNGDFFKYNGDINEYVKNCKVKESVNYPTKIMGIAKALEDMILENETYSKLIKPKV